MAAPPNLVAFVQTAGIRAVPYGPDSEKQLETQAFRDWWKLRNPVSAIRQARDYVTDGWSDMSLILSELAVHSDLILSGTTYQELAANVAEAQDIRLAALHYFPVRPNNQILPISVPMWLVNPLWTTAEWVHWRLIKSAYDEQRTSLGLSPSKVPAIRHMQQRQVLEIQAYDKVFFPGLDGQWRKLRPIVGTMTLRLSAGNEGHIESWISKGRPPIYFGFGSMLLEEPDKMLYMIQQLSATLGERALVCSPVLAREKHCVGNNILIVASVDHTKIFPRCRAIVHHGGAGTTAASVRSGTPTLILWIGADQPIWAKQIRLLGVGTSRRFASITRETLEADLKLILEPDYKERAIKLARRMTPVNESVKHAASLLVQWASRQPHTDIFYPFEPSST